MKAGVVSTLSESSLNAINTNTLEDGQTYTDLVKVVVSFGCKINHRYNSDVL